MIKLTNASATNVVIDCSSTTGNMPDTNRTLRVILAPAASYSFEDDIVTENAWVQAQILAGVLTITAGTTEYTAEAASRAVKVKNLQMYRHVGTGSIVAAGGTLDVTMSPALSGVFQVVATIQSALATGCTLKITAKASAAPYSTFTIALVDASGNPVACNVTPCVFSYIAEVTL